jgi:hypothetical protein
LRRIVDVFTHPYLVCSVNRSGDQIVAILFFDMAILFRAASSSFPDIPLLSCFSIVPTLLLLLQPVCLLPKILYAEQSDNVNAHNRLYIANIGSGSENKAIFDWKQTIDVAFVMTSYNTLVLIFLILCSVLCVARSRNV